MDSGAFSTIFTHGGYPNGVEEYAAEIQYWSYCGNLLAAVAQDYMCEPAMLKITGLTVQDHQLLTIERYDALKTELDRRGVTTHLMPVIQGYRPEEYVDHIKQYGDRLKPGMWVGVGSICKRNGNPEAVLRVLRAIKAIRPDLLIHGFGLKLTSLANAEVRSLLHTADSMAWSLAARMKNRRGGNSWWVAMEFQERIEDFMRSAA